VRDGVVAGLWYGREVEVALELRRAVDGDAKAISAASSCCLIDKRPAVSPTTTTTSKTTCTTPPFFNMPKAHGKSMDADNMAPK
jgi:hypothetical protein